MPNWCSNTVTFSHDDKRQIDRLVKAFQTNGLMQEFYPCPKELLDTRAGSLGVSDPGYEKHQQQIAANKAKYGVADWYDWRVNNWGTKWDVTSKYPHQTDVSPCGRTVTLNFDSAWSPPVEFYEHMLPLGFTIEAYYYEGGVGFCGRWEDGHDAFYDVQGPADWVEKNIPKDIDEMFGIAEEMREYEAEEENEEKQDNAANS